MKKYKSTIITCFLAFSLLISCVGLSSCDDADTERYEEFINDSADKMSSIKVGDTAYDVEYQSSRRSELDDEIYDTYTVSGADSERGGTLRINAKTKEVTGYYNITPYESIENIGELSEDEIREAAEELLCCIADFSDYNTFNLEAVSSEVGGYSAVWQLKREMLCNVSLDIHITPDGKIDRLSKTDACSEVLNEAFADADKRVAMLEKEICKYLGIWSIGGIDYEIDSETLSYHKGKEAVIYGVTIRDDDGFAESIVLTVYA